MKRYFRKYIIPVLFILLFLGVYARNLGTVQVDIEKIDGVDVIENVHIGMTIEQGFRANKNKICGIAIKFGTYARENIGYIKLELVNELNQKVATTNISKKNLVDNAYYEWYFPPISNSKNKHYILRVIDDSKVEGNEITLYKSNEKDINQVKLVKDGIEEIGGLNLITYYVN